MADGEDKYRDPLIAMAVLACIFFLILVVILVIWCKGRRKTEVKTVTIQPKKRPAPVKTVTAVSTANGNGQPANGTADVEAATSSDEPVAADEVNLETKMEDQELHAINETGKADDDDETPLHTGSAKPENDADNTSNTSAVSTTQETTTPTVMKDEGHSNPTFNDDDA